VQISHNLGNSAEENYTLSEACSKLVSLGMLWSFEGLRFERRRGSRTVSHSNRLCLWTLKLYSAAFDVLCYQISQTGQTDKWCAMCNVAC